MFENVDGRTDDGRTDDGVTGILIAHLGAFGSGELINKIVDLEDMGKLGVFHANVTSMCLDPHLN